MDLEGEEGEESYGPWMLVKRGRKKKGVLPTASNVRKVENKKGLVQGQSSTEVKASSPRIGNVGPYKGAGTVGIGLEISSRSDGDSGSFGIFVDQPKNMDTIMGQMSSKVKAQNGGKKPNIGPRTRDAKKLAWSNGSIKSSFEVSGAPIYQKKKENANPNVKPGEKGKLPLTNVASLASNQLKDKNHPPKSACMVTDAVKDKG